MQNGTVTNTTEIIHANGDVEDGPDLEKARDAHCMVLLPPGTKVILYYYSCLPLPEFS